MWEKKSFRTISIWVKKKLGTAPTTLLKHKCSHVFFWCQCRRPTIPWARWKKKKSIFFCLRYFTKSDCLPVQKPCQKKKNPALGKHQNEKHEAHNAFFQPLFAHIGIGSVSLVLLPRGDIERASISEKNRTFLNRKLPSKRVKLSNCLCEGLKYRLNCLLFKTPIN